MFSYEFVLLGFALAVDAAVVSFALGLLGHEHTNFKRISRGSLSSSFFGFFQFFMLWLGSKGGYFFSFSSYGYLFQFVVAAIFFILGIKFFQDSFSQEKRELTWGIIPLLLLSFATSIDALAAGVSFGTLPYAHIAAFEVGIITSILCFLFYILAYFFKNIPDKWLLRLAGLILASLGGHMVIGKI